MFMNMQGNIYLWSKNNTLQVNGHASFHLHRLRWQNCEEQETNENAKWKYRYPAEIELATHRFLTGRLGRRDRCFVAFNLFQENKHAEI